MNPSAGRGRTRKLLPRLTDAFAATGLDVEVCVSVDLDDAVRLAREAVDIALDTDFLNDQGDAFFDFGEVLALSGDEAGSAEAYARALECYERKGNVVSAERTRGAARQPRGGHLLTD